MNGKFLKSILKIAPTRYGKILILSGVSGKYKVHNNKKPFNSRNQTFGFFFRQEFLLNQLIERTCCISKILRSDFSNSSLLFLESRFV